MTFRPETLAALKAMTTVGDYGDDTEQCHVVANDARVFTRLAEESIQALEYMPLPYPLLTVAWNGSTVDPPHYLHSIDARPQPVKNVSNGPNVVKLVSCGATAMLNSAHRYLPSCNALLLQALAFDGSLRGAATVFASGGPEPGLPPHYDDFIAALIVQMSGSKIWHLRLSNNKEHEVRLSPGDEMVMSGAIEHSATADPYSLHCTFRFDRSMPALQPRRLSLESWLRPEETMES